MPEIARSKQFKSRLRSSSFQMRGQLGGLPAPLSRAQHGSGMEIALPQCCEIWCQGLCVILCYLQLS
ncbi:hypothetical protein AAFF_G00210960 [Aldrovandia affinis]|uniref:Uncharacterized protein n=1 Tax=Aldrovandia affinis TaxID=143900 RepID=A0AAD7WV31_9TELE|nr:hypothetical protein AAFF_G00210960 [Aldrovandia affinis]